MVLRFPVRTTPPQRYAQMAAAEDVDNTDLVGVVTWNLVRLNRNGFRANPNGTGISGLVDAKSFFNPECGASPQRGGGLDDDSGGILGSVAMTQYMEVSIPAPVYAAICFYVQFVFFFVFFFLL